MLDAGSTIHDAGQMIELLLGFETALGVLFEARIGGCEYVCPYRFSPNWVIFQYP